ncbi:HPr kinase/phosphorylase [Shimia biformata]|uniref:HPr kinase/phosphorylase n=1 Tax=Shimia biformata TaxID=1294299 RepID=UPI00194F7007|nr:HPr kinase/phosphatase C-terminal domain-containing protein [Shimia biformata]
MRGKLPPADSEVLHASTVALNGRAVLITGPSGSGKSALALHLMGFGARLISDDRTCVWMTDGRLVAAAPPAIHGQIEARGVGILTAEADASAEVVLCVDLSRRETDRLPHPHVTIIHGIELPLVLRVDAAHFAPAILQILKGERRNA